MNYNKNDKRYYEQQLRNGCTRHQGIGLRDIIRIRQERGIEYVKPHMVGKV